MLPVNQDSNDYKFFQTLNEDIKLLPNEYGEWDMVFENDDIVNVTGAESLANAIEKYIEEAVKRMRRVRTINYIQVKPYMNGYNVTLAVTSINDTDVTLTMELK